MTAHPGIPADRHIVLVGLMGSGKSSVGRRLADVLGLPFVDADDEIEKAAGCTIVEIFRLYGEQAFRDGERRVLARILEAEQSVVATGGGAFIDSGNRELIGQHGVSVWLRAEVDELYRRTRRRSHRPILNAGNPRTILEKLARERYPVYAKADITVETGGEKPDETAERILAALEKTTTGRIEAT